MGHLCNFQLSIDASTNKPQPVNKGQEHNILDEFYRILTQQKPKRRRVSRCFKAAFKTTHKLWGAHAKKQNPSRFRA